MVNTEHIIKNLKLFWQYPVITEKMFYLQENNNPNYFGLPWATIYELVRPPETRQHNVQVLYDHIIPYINENESYYTCCQHIAFRAFIQLWKELNINVVYTPHKKKGEDVIDGITIKSSPLYAVSIEDKSRNDILKDKDLLNTEREILYSFAGGYQPADYLTDIRQRIYKMKHPPNTLIIDTGLWHFNDIVFDEKQNINGELNVDDNHVNKTDKYNSILLNSRYTLAPSGSGPNSIRFWEALGVGSIPILLSDTLELPAHPLWEKAIVIVKEDELENISDILSKIDEIEERTMRKNCFKIYRHFKNNYINK